jgi:subtilisin family serine protease
VLRGPVDVAALAADPRVARVAPNTLERKLGFPTDALFWRRGWQWNLRQIEADAAAATGAGRTVCVVDGGVDPRHQDLAGKVALARAFPGAAPYAADFDADGHGTHVAGTVTSNGIGAAAASPTRSRGAPAAAPT